MTIIIVIFGIGATNHHGRHHRHLGGIHSETERRIYWRGYIRLSRSIHSYISPALALYLRYNGLDARSFLVVLSIAPWDNARILMLILPLRLFGDIL